MIIPYYHDEMVEIYCGDAREIIPRLEGNWAACITDPVWPNPLPSLRGSEDPYGLFAETIPLLVTRIERLVVQLGANSDPRFLQGVPVSLPFLRVCWLRYARPSYLGRFLNGGDVAYCFGTWPKSRKGAHVLPGECTNTDANWSNEHPCPRRKSHVRWLVSFWGQGSVIDPFAGSGTTGLMCAEMGIPCTMIDVEEKFCAIAADAASTRQGVLT